MNDRAISWEAEQMNNSRKKYQVLDGTTLKIIAMISMVFDHVGSIFFPDATWPRMIGRLAMPIFSFCIAEGFTYTKDKKKYLCRLGVFALISEIPFDLAFEGNVGFSHQNIMLSFFLSVAALMLYDRVQGEADSERKHPSVGKTVLGVCAVAAFAVLSFLLRADYTFFAVFAVFLFYVFRKRHPLIRAGVGVAFLSITRTIGYYCATGFSFIPLAMYNGKKGKGLKWMFYLFYPGHLLLLAAIKHILPG
jgi:hypothetical protein